MFTLEKLALFTKRLKTLPIGILSILLSACLESDRITIDPADLIEVPIEGTHKNPNPDKEGFIKYRRITSLPHKQYAVWEGKEWLEGRREEDPKSVIVSFLSIGKSEKGEDRFLGIVPFQDGTCKYIELFKTGSQFSFGRVTFELKPDIEHVVRRAAAKYGVRIEKGKLADYRLTGQLTSKKLGALFKDQEFRQALGLMSGREPLYP